MAGGVGLRGRRGERGRALGAARLAGWIQHVDHHAAVEDLDAPACARDRADGGGLPARGSEDIARGASGIRHVRIAGEEQGEPARRFLNGVGGCVGELINKAAEAWMVSGADAGRGRGQRRAGQGRTSRHAENREPAEHVSHRRREEGRWCGGEAVPAGR